MQQRTTGTAVLATAFIAALASTATAKIAVITYSDCQPGTERLSGPLGPGAPPTINIPIPTPKTAAQKRDWILQQLNQQFPMIMATPLDAASMVIRNIPAAAQVGSSSGDTGSQSQVRTAGATNATIAFPLHFDPMDRTNQTASFTAGIVTDVGVLTDHVSAAELNFQTDGPIICQALFQRLAPRAPQYGAQINYAGDRLEVYFDPAYTVNPGGVISGSTSRSQQQETRVYLPDDMMAGDMVTDYVFAAGQPGVMACKIDNNGDFRVDLVIQPILVSPLPPAQTRDAALNAMLAASVPAVDFGPNMIQVPTTQPQADMRSGSASTSGTVLRPGTTNAEVKFPNTFAPLDRNGQPAVFTAGIVTDVGALSVSVSAAELNFQTDGPIICQALFQRLAPRAPQYGAQINYAGDRLEVYFDPAYTVTQGGASGGTTSPTPGVIWSINPDLSAPGSGDLNIDRSLNGLDIQPLFQAMISSAQYWNAYPAGDIDQADLNGDHVLNNLDVAQLRDRLLGR